MATPFVDGVWLHHQPLDGGRRPVPRPGRTRTPLALGPGSGGYGWVPAIHDTAVGGVNRSLARALRVWTAPAPHSITPALYPRFRRSRRSLAPR